MIASVAEHQPGESSPTLSYLLTIYSTGPCEGLKPRIIEIAQREGSPGGSAAVEVLVVLNAPRES